MKPIFQAVLMLGLVIPASSATPEIDFDGENNEHKSITTDINEALQNGSAELYSLETQKAITPSKNEDYGIPTTRLIKIKEEDGEEEIVSPIPTSDGKTTWEFMPNDYRIREFGCVGQDPRPWSICWSVDFRPAAAGHDHPPTTTLSFINPSNGQLLPTKICKYNIPANIPFRIPFKAPVYSVRVLEKAEFYGSCQAVLQDEELVRVTAQNLIQLTPLQPEPYFVFKIPDEHHPSNRFATPDTIAKLKRIAWEYYSVYQPTTTEKMITINDIGLVWGGRYHTFDPHNCWTDGQYHFYHRYGRQVDVRSWNIPQANRACFKEIACKYQVHPILEGKAPGTIPERDYSNISFFEADVLDRVEHYHLNFARPTDPPVNPLDDDDTICSSFIPPPVSACPKPLGHAPLP